MSITCCCERGDKNTDIYGRVMLNFFFRLNAFKPFFDKWNTIDSRPSHWLGFKIFKLPLKILADHHWDIFYLISLLKILKPRWIFGMQKRWNVLTSDPWTGLRASCLQIYRRHSPSYGARKNHCVPWKQRQNFQSWHIVTLEKSSSFSWYNK